MVLLGTMRARQLDLTGFDAGYDKGSMFGLTRLLRDRPPCPEIVELSLLCSNSFFIIHLRGQQMVLLIG